MTTALQNVLVVEDNPQVRMIVKLSLEKVGRLNVRVCSTGEEALEAATTFAPQLILLDVMMPGMDGPAVLKRLRQLPETLGIPVIFLTAKTTANELRELRELGAVDVIAKPFDPMTLHQQIKDIWDGL